MFQLKKFHCRSTSKKISFDIALACSVLLSFVLMLSLSLLMFIFNTYE